MSEAIRQKILKSIDDMPSLPLTALKILRLANDINSTPQEMLDTIKVDPVITAKVLQMINSSYFGLSANVTDLRQALVMLGANTVKNLALTSALLNTMSSKGAGNNKLDLDGLWLHSLATAVASKIIAREVGLPRLKHDELFIVGLLHDIGKIFSFQFLADEYVAVINEANAKELDIKEAEEAILSMTVTAAGGMLAKKWQLPENMLSAISHYREPEQAGEFQKICAIVNIASYFASIKNIGWNDGLPIIEPSQETLELAGVTLNQLQDPLLVMDEEIEKAKSFIQE